MPRPSDITSEELAAWAEDLRQYEATDEGADRLAPVDAEVWYGGMYLRKELRKQSKDEDLVERIVFACGQRQAFADDPWQPVLLALANFGNGFWEEPGEELARRILHEKFGPKPNPIEILNYMSERKKIDFEKMVKIVLQGKPKTPWEKEDE